MKNDTVWLQPENDGNIKTWRVDELLNKGWIIKSVSAQHVASATGYNNSAIFGGFLVVLEKGDE